MSNSLDPEQAGHFVVPDLGPNCLQNLAADDTRKELVILQTECLTFSMGLNA